MPKNIYKTYDDAQERTHSVVLDGETGLDIDNDLKKEIIENLKEMEK